MNLIIEILMSNGGLCQVIKIGWLLILCACLFLGRVGTKHLNS